MKKLFAGLILIVLILAVPTLYALSIQGEIPTTKPEIKEEDYFILEDEPPFQMKSLPKDEVEVYMSDDRQRQVVEMKKEGLSFQLPTEYTISSLEIEPGVVRIYKDGECETKIGRIQNTKNMTAEEWFAEDIATYTEFGMLNIIEQKIEKIDVRNINAYKTLTISEEFGPEEGVLIEGPDGVYAISQAGVITESCNFIFEILQNLTFSR